MFVDVRSDQCLLISTLSSTTIYRPYNWWQHRSFISTPYFISSSVLQVCTALVLHLYFIMLGVNFYVPRLLWSTIYPVPLTRSYFYSTRPGELRCCVYAYRVHVPVVPVVPGQRENLSLPQFCKL